MTIRSTLNGQTLLRNASARIAKRKHLYRYRRLDGKHRDRFAEFMETGKIHCSAFASLRAGDPFDGRARFTFAASPSRVRSYATREARTELTVGDVARVVGSREEQRLAITRLETMVGTFGVCCLCERGDDLPMWSYYCGGHSGLCLQFDTETLWGGFQGEFLIPVKYRPHYQAIPYLDTDDIARVWSLLGFKARQWKHEREWRLVVQSRSGLLEYPAESLRSIIVGHLMQPQERALVRNLVERHRPWIDLFEAVPSSSKYGLDIVPLADG